MVSKDTQPEERVSFLRLSGLRFFRCLLFATGRP